MKPSIVLAIIGGFLYIAETYKEVIMNKKMIKQILSGDFFYLEELCEIESPKVCVVKNAADLEIESIRIIPDGVLIWHSDCEDHGMVIVWEDILLNGDWVNVPKNL